MTITDSGQDIIIDNTDSYPKSMIRTRRNVANTVLYLLYGEKKIKSIASNSEVTNIASSSLSDLQNKILLLLDPAQAVVNLGSATFANAADFTTNSATKVASPAVINEYLTTKLTYNDTVGF